MRPLPPEEVEFLASLPIPQRNSRLRELHEAGWSLQALAQATDIPKTTVHFRIHSIASHEECPRRPIPAPPRSVTALLPSPYSTRIRSISPKVPPDLRPRLRQLSEMSRRYRSRTPSGSQTALANAELTQLAVTLRRQGVPTSDIASAAGVSYRAMARRIAQAMKKAG